MAMLLTRFALISIILGLNLTSYAALSRREAQVRRCMQTDDDRQPVIIDSDVYPDDYWAFHYLLNVPTIDILAITTVGDGFGGPFYTGSNALRFLDLIGCGNRVPVAFGLNVPLLSSGLTFNNEALKLTDTYLTAPTCLNQSAANIYIQPSPFGAVELIVLALKYSPKPVDILVLGTMTNIAAAISQDRSIVSKIRTLYFSGGQFQSTRDYASLLPDLQSLTFPYTRKTSGSSSNVFMDVLAVQRVGESGIKKLVAMPSLTQRQVEANFTQLDRKLKQLNITLKPFVYNLLSSLARCTNDTSSHINWWDNSAAALMVQMQSVNKRGFCTETKTVKSLYIVAADAFQLFGHGMIDIELQNRQVKGLTDYEICTTADSDIFITEFLTKIHANKLPACQKPYSHRFDIRLQKCLIQHGLGK